MYTGTLYTWHCLLLGQGLNLFFAFFQLRYNCVLGFGEGTVFMYNVFDIIMSDENDWFTKCLFCKCKCINHSDVTEISQSLKKTEWSSQIDIWYVFVHQFRSSQSDIWYTFCSSIYWGIIFHVNFICGMYGEI